MFVLSEGGGGGLGKMPSMGGMEPQHLESKAFRNPNNKIFS